MKRILYLFVIVPLLVCCGKNDKPENQEPDNNQPEQPQDELPVQIKDGDVVLATNPNVEKFITTVT